MSRYAQDTEVSTDKSRSEIERTLKRYGADQFMYGWKDVGAVIAFRAHGRHIRFTLPLPDRNAREFTHPRVNQYTELQPVKPERATEKHEQACRQSWRALALCIKAKLEAVAAGITQFDDEFMAQIVLPNGQTMSEHAQPLIARAYETGKMPPLLGYDS